METKNQSVDLKLIQRAQQGQQSSQSLLAELTKQVVFPYLYRLTFNYHLAEDLCQETLFEMHKSLTKLKFQSKRAYFAWIYRTALSKVRRYYRNQDNKRLHMISDSTVLEQNITDPKPNQVEHMIQKELLQAAVAAMQKLKLNYRNILTIRCFDGLSYEEIASIEGSSQLACRLRFFKARKALKQYIARRGFDESYLLPALALFGTITLPKSAEAVAVATSSVVTGALSVGKGVSLLSMVVSKVSALAVVCFAAVFVTLSHFDLFNVQHGTSWSTQDIKEHIEQGIFACPTKVIRDGLPKGAGLICIEPSGQGRLENIIDKTKIIECLNINDPRLIRMHKRHWIEFVFGDKSLINGPGPDLFIRASGCKGYRIVLTDGHDQQYELTEHVCPKNHPLEQTMAFDFEGHNIDFEPKAMRVYVVPAVVESCGFELNYISARVSK
jgi:RNA polymerase sigma-70 factor (ECF subfamily)